MKNKGIEYEVHYYDNKHWFDRITGTEKTEAAAIKRIWSLISEHNVFDAWFVTKDGKRVSVSTVSGKVHRE